MPPKSVKKPGAGGDMTFVHTTGAKSEPKSVPPITEEQIIALNEQAQEIISKEPDEIRHAKDAAMRLAGSWGRCDFVSAACLPEWSR